MHRKAMAVRIRELARNTAANIHALQEPIRNQASSGDAYTALLTLIEAQHPMSTLQILKNLTNRDIRVQNRCILIRALSTSRLSFVVPGLVKLLPPGIDLAASARDNVSMKTDILITLSVIAKDPDTDKADQNIARAALRDVALNPLQPVEVRTCAANLLNIKTQLPAKEEKFRLAPQRPADVIALSRFRRDKHDSRESD